MTIDSMMELRKLKTIRRFNLREMIQTDTDASHSYYTTILAIDIADYINKTTNYKFSTEEFAALMIEALYHDSEESILGDVITPTKYSEANFSEYLVAYRALTNTIRTSMLVSLPGVGLIDKNYTTTITLGDWVLKLADKLEAYTTSSEEIWLGNKFFVPIRDSILSAISKILFEVRVSDDFAEYSETLIEYVNSYRNRVESYLSL